MFKLQFALEVPVMVHVAKTFRLRISQVKIWNKPAMQKGQLRDYRARKFRTVNLYKHLCSHQSSNQSRRGIQQNMYEFRKSSCLVINNMCRQICL
jgi:hypothetical protein